MYKISIWNAVILMTLAAVLGVGAVSWRLPNVLKVIMLIVAAWLVILAVGVFIILIRYHAANQFRIYQEARNRTVEVVLLEKLGRLSDRTQREVMKRIDWENMIVVQPGLGVYWQLGNVRVPEEFILRWAEHALEYAQENPGKLPPVRLYRSKQLEYEWATAIVRFIHNRTEMIRLWGGNEPATLEPGYSLTQIFEFLGVEI